jgi:hypothetical protein
VYACMVEICCQSSEFVFNRLLDIFIPTHAHATPKTASSV